jgi:hypothetical protein
MAKRPKASYIGGHSIVHLSPFGIRSGPKRYAPPSAPKSRPPPIPKGTVVTLNGSKKKRKVSKKKRQIQRTKIAILRRIPVEAFRDGLPSGLYSKKKRRFRQKKRSL